MKEKNNSPEAAPATTDPSPAKMTRRRLPGRFAITLTVLHSLSPIACLAAIGAAGYAVGKNQAAGLEMIGTFIAALWTIGVEVAEVAALADRKRKRIRRFPAKFLYLVELLTAIICFAVPSVPMFVYSEVRYERCRYLKSSEQEQRPDCKSVMGSSGPGDPAPLGAIGVMYLAGTIHSLLFVMTAVHFWAQRRKARAATAREGAARGEKGALLAHSQAGSEPPNLPSEPPKVRVRG